MPRAVDCGKMHAAAQARPPGTLQVGSGTCAKGPCTPDSFRFCIPCPRGMDFPDRTCPAILLLHCELLPAPSSRHLPPGLPSSPLHVCPASGPGDRLCLEWPWEPPALAPPDPPLPFCCSWCCTRGFPAAPGSQNGWLSGRGIWVSHPYPQVQVFHSPLI